MKLKEKLKRFWKTFRKIKWLFTIQFFIGFVLCASILVPIKKPIQIIIDPVFSNLDIETMDAQIEMINEISRLINLCMDEFDEMTKFNKEGVIICPDSGNSD